MGSVGYWILVAIIILLLALAGLNILLTAVMMRGVDATRTGVQQVLRTMEQGVVLVEDDEVDAEWEELNKNGWGNGPH